jgi:hypothetical protein
LWVWSPGDIDGIPGKRMNSAVAQFKQQQGLGTSSAIEPRLTAALQSKFNASDLQMKVAKSLEGRDFAETI